MVKGTFKSFRHEHHFESTGNGTRMTDRFDYKPPFGILGKFQGAWEIERNEELIGGDKVNIYLIYGSWWMKFVSR